MPVWFEPVSAPKAVRAARLLSLLDFVSPNEAELAAMAAAVRRQAGSGQRQQQQGQQQQSAGGSSCPRPPGGKPAGTSAAGPQSARAAAAEAALRPLLPDLATLLQAGVRHVVLTLGADGAALCTLAPGAQAVAGGWWHAVVLQGSASTWQRHLQPAADAPHCCYHTACLPAVCHLPALPATVVNCSGAGDCLVAGCLYGLAQGLSAEASLAHGTAAAHAAVQSASNVPPGLDAAAVARVAAAALAQRTLLRLPLPPGC